MRITCIFLISCLFMIIGCKSDSSQIKEITKDDLFGEWVIYHATRNGKETKSLEKGNFVFQADNLVSSNLFTSSNSLNFTYDKGTIAFEGDPNMDFLKVEKLQNDTLILSSKLQAFKMEFFLAKK